MYLIGTTLILFVGLQTAFVPTESRELALIAFSLSVVLFAKKRYQARQKRNLKKLNSLRAEYEKRFGSVGHGQLIGHAAKVGTHVVSQVTGGGWVMTLSSLFVSIGTDLIGRPQNLEKVALKAKIKAQAQHVRWERTKFWLFVIAHFAALNALYALSLL